MEPGEASYAALVKEFGKEILEDGAMENSPISRPKLAKIAMASEESRLRLNGLTHPLVQQAVEGELKRLAEEDFCGVAVIEAALLIEAGYKALREEVLKK